MRFSSITEKCPPQSVRLFKIETAVCAILDGDEGIIRNKIIPGETFNFLLKTNSPKSLSKVIKIRFSFTAISKTSASVIPGAISYPGNIVSY